MWGMLRVGLTGGIGAGKSSVARRLVELGAVLADGDRLAREVLEAGSEGLAAVAQEFGDGVIAADGTLDRAALAAIVFSDDDARARLEAITHPRIGQEAHRILTAAGPGGVGVYDMPLLVEKDAASQFHLTIVVMVEVEERVRRLIEHRGFTEADARARIDAQASDEQRLAAADVVLHNDGSPEDLVSIVDALWEQRMVPFARNVADHVVAAAGAEASLEDPAATGARLASRVRRALAEGDIEADGLEVSDDGSREPAVVELLVRVPDLTLADACADTLAAAGFPRHPDSDPGPDAVERLHGSADPGRPVNLRLRPNS